MGEEIGEERAVPGDDEGIFTLSAVLYMALEPVVVGRVARVVWVWCARGEEVDEMLFVAGKMPIVGEEVARAVEVACGRPPAEGDEAAIGDVIGFPVRGFGEGVDAVGDLAAEILGGRD